MGIQLDILKLEGILTNLESDNKNLRTQNAKLVEALRPLTALHFHNHPGMESKHKIPSAHTVIDLYSYQKVLGIIDRAAKVLKEVEG
jgi:hypothetical protein